MSINSAIKTCINYKVQLPEFLSSRRRCGRVGVGGGHGAVRSFGLRPHGCVFIFFLPVGSLL